MKNIPDEKQRQIVTKVLSNANVDEKIALSQWAEQLLAIKRSDYSKVVKGKEAIKLTARSRVVIPVLKIIAKEFKLDGFDISKIKITSYKQVLKSIKQFWTKRSLPVQLGIGVSTIAAVIFGSQGAGIAALGTAIGVPLWVVFGAGATFAGVLYEEINGRKPDVTTTYKIIDAVQETKLGFWYKVKNYKTGRGEDSGKSSD